VRLALALVLSAVLASLAACGKKKPLTDSLPVDQVTADDLAREATRVAAGEAVGQALAAPKIELDVRGVTVNGALVVAPGELDAATLVRIPKLFAWLKGLREHWQTIHPGATFPGVFDFDAAPEADALIGESVIETAAAAGFPRVRLTIEETAWDAPFKIPRPLADADVAKRDARLRLRRALVGWEIDVLVPGPCDPRPSVKARVVKADALAAIVDDVCKGDVGDCYLSVEASSGALLTVAKLIAPAFGPGRPTNVSVDFFGGEEVSVDGDAGAIGGAFDAAPPLLASNPTTKTSPKKPAKVVVGEIQISGRLAPDAVDKAVRAKAEAARACYEDELRRSPSLQGRVAVKLGVDASGSIAQACDGGSTLPSSAVIACIVQASSTLAFPAPESGTATVLVPMMLSLP
jgi:predicted small lipoprotein YifL